MTPESSEPRTDARAPTPPTFGMMFPASIAGLALAASVLDLLLFRGVLQVISSLAHREVALSFEGGARLVRNVAAVLVFLGVAIATHRAMRSPNVGFGVVRRVFLGMLSGVLFPVLGIALLFPDAHTTIVLVLIGILAGYLTALLYGLTAFDFDAPIDQRVSCAFVLLYSFASLAGFVIQVGSNIGGIESATTMLHAARNCVEITYFGLPVSLGVAEFARATKPTSRSIAIAIGAGAVAFACISAVDSVLPADFDLLLYGALRLDALESTSPLLYASLFAASVAGITLACRDRSRVRLGLGAAFILLAGAGAGSPFAIAHVVLGAAALGLVGAYPRSDDADSPEPSTAGTSAQVVS